MRSLILRRSQVSLTTVFTVSFGALSVVALVFFLLKTTVALTLTLGSAMAAVAMDHAVEALVRRGLRRPWAIVAVMGAVTALLVGMGLLLLPPIVTQGKALAAEMPPSGRSCSTPRGSCTSTNGFTCRSSCAIQAPLPSAR
jgi:predicted PurR-regulated permease PerM